MTTPFCFARPEDVMHCTGGSVCVDVWQHAADKMHPHAYYDRGYFFEASRVGERLDGDWDFDGVRFDQLLEFKAVKDHYDGRSLYRYSFFSERFMKYIRLNKNIYPYDPLAYIVNREKGLDELINSALRIGILPARSLKPERESDEISVNVSRSGKLLFNNRGHHRLAVSKIIGLNIIPIQKVVIHASYIDI